MKKAIIPYIIFFFSLTCLYANSDPNNSFAPVQMKFFSKEISFSTHQYTIEISHNHTAQLNSITIGLPCGKISDFSNTENWPVRYDVLDKQSGIYGFRLTNNKSAKQLKSMIITFEITALGDYCQNIFETWRPKLAYSYGGKLYKETLSTEKSDIPATINFENLEKKVAGKNIEVSTSNDLQTQETIFDVISKKSDDISLEIYDIKGIKISTMFIGQIKEGIRNFITFKYDVLKNKHYIFKLSSSSGDLYGKIILPQ